MLPDDEVIHEHLGDVLQALGKTAAAAAAYEKSLELKPDNEAVRTKLQQLGRPQ